MARHESTMLSALQEDGTISSSKNEELIKPKGLGIRHLETLLMFFGITVAYMLRVNMSVAIVAMSNSATANPDIVDFGWDSSTQSYILSSFFWGFVVTQLPAGYIAQRWSATKLWALCMLVCGVVNMIIPIAAEKGGWIAVCACRIIMGLSQGCVYPSAHTLLGKWIPPEERARLATSAYAGAQFGTVIGFSVSGFLAASSIGWPSIFYLVGALTVLWSIAFYIWSDDSPSHHRSITREESDYIEQSLGQTDIRKKLSTPWKAILTSVPVWTLIIVHCGQAWGYWTLLTEIPSYMSAILLFDISKNGVISALPYLAMWLLSFPFSWFADYVLTRGWVSRAVSRKVSNSIGHWGPAVALMGLGYATADNTVVAIVILVFAVGLNAGMLSGFQINHIDLSPNFAGSLMSLTTCIAGIMAIVAPLIAGVIVTDLSDVTQWRIVFFISAGVYIVCNTLWLVFGEAEVQPWNEPKMEQNSELGNSRGINSSARKETSIGEYTQVPRYEELEIKKEKEDQILE